MLVLLSNLLTSQVTDTKNSKCFSPEQLSEVYRGLKQGEYLKVRITKTEEVLEEANGIMNQQKQAMAQYAEIVKNKNLVIENLTFQIEKEKEICSAEKEQLNNTIKMNEIVLKAESKRKFWNGIKIGGLAVGIAGVATILLLNN